MRKILSLLIVTAIAMSVSMPISATPLTQQSNNQNKQIASKESAFTKMQMDSEKLDISIEMLDSEIENIYLQIDKAKGDINDTEKKVEQTTKDIITADNNIHVEEILFNQRMRVMFMNGADSYLEILLSSDGVGDFLSRVENVKKVIEYDNKIIEELNAKKKNIENIKKSLNDDKVNITTLEFNNKGKLDKLIIKKKEQSQLIVEAKKQKELNNNEISETQALLSTSMNQIRGITNQTPKSDVLAENKKAEVNTALSRGVTYENKNETNVVTKEDTKVELKMEIAKEISKPETTSAVSTNEVVTYAESFMGTPYEWAGKGPSTFDCSGFVRYVYAYFGVKLGNSTYEQIKQGKIISREDLQPGDLVFFGTGSPYHVGMYIGNNRYIHAPKTGDVVKESALTRSDYLSARRVR